MKLALLFTKGLLCLYDKQNNTWLLVDTEFLSSCSNRHLTRSLRSHVFKSIAHNTAVSEKLEDKFHTYARPCIILHLSPM